MVWVCCMTWIMEEMAAWIRILYGCVRHYFMHCISWWASCDWDLLLLKTRPSDKSKSFVTLASMRGVCKWKTTQSNLANKWSRAPLRMLCQSIRYKNTRWCSRYETSIKVSKRRLIQTPLRSPFFYDILILLSEFLHELYIIIEHFCINNLLGLIAVKQFNPKQ